MRPISVHEDLPLAVRVYRVLLFAYPPGHRCKYGPLMVQLFRDRCRDVLRQRGWWGLVQLWGHVLKDTLITAVDEHLDELEERSRRMTRRQHILSAVCAVGPLVLWTGLLIINPTFAGRVFTTPLGWCVVVAVLLLLSMGYVLQRGVLVRSNAADSSHLLARKPALRIVALVGTIAFLVLPALTLILLGPAVVTVSTMMGP